MFRLALWLLLLVVAIGIESVAMSGTAAPRVSTASAVDRSAVGATIRPASGSHRHDNALQTLLVGDDASDDDDSDADDVLPVCTASVTFRCDPHPAGRARPFREVTSVRSREHRRLVERPPSA
jgi:hypothetical protein